MTWVGVGAWVIVTALMTVGIREQRRANVGHVTRIRRLECQVAELQAQHRRTREALTLLNEQAEENSTRSSHAIALLTGGQGGHLN